MQRIPILALPSLGLLIIVVLLVFMQPPSSETPTPIIVPTPTAIVTHTPIPYECHAANDGNLFTIICEKAI